MKNNKKIIFILAIVVCLASAVFAYGAVPQPASNFYAADYADVLTDETESYIAAMNGDLEYYCDGAQIVVLTVDFLDGMDIEDYCYKVINDWQVGGSANNGVLLLLAIGEENYWCMTGKGLENHLTAGEIDDLLWYNLEDYFAMGDYDTGVRVTFDLLFNEIGDIYGVSKVPADDGYYDDYYDDYYGEDYSDGDVLLGFVILVIIFAIIVLIICIISSHMKRKALEKARREKGYPVYPQPRPTASWQSRPYNSSPFSPYNKRPARKIYIPTPVNRPRTYHGGGLFGGGTSSGGGLFGGSTSSPARPRPSTSRPVSRPSSFGGGSRSSFGSGSRGGMNRGGGGMSRGGGAGRRGR